MRWPNWKENSVSFVRQFPSGESRGLWNLKIVSSRLLGSSASWPAREYSRGSWPHSSWGTSAGQSLPSTENPQSRPRSFQTSHCATFYPLSKDMHKQLTWNDYIRIINEEKQFYPDNQSLVQIWQLNQNYTDGDIRLIYNSIWQALESPFGYFSNLPMNIKENRTSCPPFIIYCNLFDSKWQPSTVACTEFIHAVWNSNSYMCYTIHLNSISPEEHQSVDDSRLYWRLSDMPEFLLPWISHRQQAGCVCPSIALARNRISNVESASDLAWKAPWRSSQPSVNVCRNHTVTATAQQWPTCPAPRPNSTPTMAATMSAYNSRSSKNAAAFWDSSNTPTTSYARRTTRYVEIRVS